MPGLKEAVSRWWNGAEAEAHVTAIGARTDTMLSTGEAARFILDNFQMEDGTKFSEAFTQADIELALDDRGWLVGGKRMAGELDPLSRQVQVNRSRYYWLRDPLVKQAVRLWTDYCLGAQAMSWTVPDDAAGEDDGEQDEADGTADSKPEGQAKAKTDEKNPMQVALDKFMHDRRNRRVCSRQGQRRISNKLLVDGELFFAFFEDGTVRLFDTLQMTDILTDPDDEDRVLGYKRITAAAQGAQPKTLYYRDWTNVDAETTVSGEQQPYYGNEVKSETVSWEDGVCVYHLPFDPMDKRGTTLVSACSDWAKEHRRFMTARVAIQQALARFAFKGKVKGGTQAINSIRSKMESTFAQTGLSGGTEHQPPNAPGGVFLQNEGMDLEAMPRMTGATEARADADSLKLMVSAGTGIMLHYFGDPSTGNLATATAMELPMMKMFESYQQLWKDAWREMFGIILDKDLQDDDVTISLPDIIEEDLQKLAAFITSLTTVFPESKTPAVLRRCLESMGVDDLDEVMAEIDENRDKIDAQNQQNREDTLAGKNVAVDPKTGKPVINPPQVKAADPYAAEAIRNIVAQLNKLTEAMSAPPSRAKEDKRTTVVEGAKISLNLGKHSTKRTGKARRNAAGEIEFSVEDTTNGE